MKKGVMVILETLKNLTQTLDLPSPNTIWLIKSINKNTVQNVAEKSFKLCKHALLIHKLKPLNFLSQQKCKQNYFDFTPLGSVASQPI